MIFRGVQGSVREIVKKLSEKFFEVTSQPARYLKKLPSETPLKRIGTLRKIKAPFFGKEKLYVELFFKGHPVAYVPFELITLLVSASRYQKKDRIPNIKRPSVEFTVKSVIDSYQDCNGDFCYRLNDETGREFHIRHIELARILFFHNAHLVRTAFRPNGLSGLVDIFHDDGKTVIRFNQLSDYPVSNLSSRSARSHLSWLFLDSDARLSFGSILNNWVMNESDTWVFEFSLPNLESWSLSVRINPCESPDDEYLVDEVLSVLNPKFQYQNEIEFEHSRYREPAEGKLLPRNRPEVPPPDLDPDMNLHAVPGLGLGLNKHNDTNFFFTFETQPNTEIVNAKKRSGVLPIVNPDKVPESDQAAVGHAELGGEAQELDHRLNYHDDCDKEAELVPGEDTSQFLIFRELIKSLAGSSKINGVEVGCYEIPPPTSKSRVALETQTGKPSQYHLATLCYEDVPFSIVEVDTQSLKKKRALSTLILGFKKDGTEGISAVMQSCSNLGVKWDRGIIDEHCSIWGPCRHPNKRKKDKNERTNRSSEEYLNAWRPLLLKGLERAAERYRQAR